MNRMSFYVNEKAIKKAIKEHYCYDSWGEVEYGNDKYAVDYNICIDNTTEETEYCSAFYKIQSDENGVLHHDDCSECYVYNIDFKELIFLLTATLVERNERTFPSSNWLP